MRLEISVLGRFAVRRDGVEVATLEFGGRLTRQLIRLLAARQDVMVSRDALVEALWGDHRPADPDANLNALVNRARRALGDATLILTVAGGYVLRADPAVVVDAEVFEGIVDHARGLLDDDPAATLAVLDTALAIWGEPWPEDAYTEWARPHRDRLQRVHQDALEIGATVALRVGDARRAVALAANAVAAAPLREAAHLMLIRALAAGGDQAAALNAYEQLRQRLAEELGIDPSREAAELHGRLLRGELAPTPPPRPSEAPGAPFVGRDRELAALRSTDHVALVVGPPGSGKSRLLAEFAATSRRPVIAARAVLPEREAPWSLARGLLRGALRHGTSPATTLPPRSRAALAELLPELSGVGGQVAIDPQTWRSLVLESCVRLLEATAPALLVVDDLQWADASSLEVLASVAARAQNVVLVIAYRPEESAARGFLADLRIAYRPVEIQLGPLDAAAIRRLVEDPELAAVLAQETDGTPFAVLDVVRAVTHDAADDVLDHARRVARAGRRRSILRWAERQPPASRELLGLLALVGRPASPQLLAEAAGVSTATVTAQVQALARAELVCGDDRGFAVAHDLVGDTVRDSLDPLERVRLHQLLARALASHPAAPGERARHLAGAGDRPEATRAYAAAARERLDHFDDREAERLAEAGLALVPADAVRGDLLEVRAETRARAGDLRGTRDDLRTALNLAETAAARSRLLTRLAVLASGSDDLIRAATLVDLALVEAGGNPAARARALATSAIIDMNLEHRARANSRYDEALTLFEQVGDARGVADILDARAMAVFLDGDIDAAIDAFERVAQIFTDSGNLLRVVTPRSTRGHALVFGGRPEEGLADTEAALDLTRSLGYAEGEAMVLWHHSEALTTLGRTAEATDAAANAVSIAERVGHRGWTATALRSLGIAQEAAGFLDAAEAAFRRSLQKSEHLPLFTSWAHARLALVLMATGRFEEAVAHVDRALAAGPPLGHYEARLARCALAVARREPGTSEMLHDAIHRASTGGHSASQTRLGTLLESWEAAAGSATHLDR